MLVSAARLVLTTCAADVTDQVVTRRNDFPKPLMLYDVLNVFGPNLIATEGAAWRRHRRITAPSFSEKNNELVWGESLRQARAMLRVWLDGGEEGTVHDVSEASLRLTLHVIGRAGFGMELSWPQGAGRATAGAGTSSLAPPASMAGDGIASGSRMSFFDALHALLANILWILLVPRVVLSAFLFADAGTRPSHSPSAANFSPNRVQPAQGDEARITGVRRVLSIRGRIV